ncbi:hypothetical protein VA7868_03373 [Vibrio aerogenes CECT 7868]|uniref:Uncharacterized protein n=2 Tax=Vibrio aerogenes TaxID=92172 RepID=A0A1M5ZX26_9VIBR|nr:hypothetical protein VA7868_03373 [Vibrio aerogenes CECT 7868]
MRLMSFWFGVIFSVLSFSSVADQFAIITYTSAFPSLTSSQVKMLYRGRLNHIEGQNVLLVDLPMNSNVRKHFYLMLLGKTPTQMQAIRARQSFSGKQVPPYELSQENIESVEYWLTEHPNGIAYVPLQWVSDKVHILYQFGDEEAL